MTQRPIFIEMDGDIVYADCPKCGGTSVTMVDFLSGPQGIDRATVRCNGCSHTETYGRRALENRDG